MDRLQILNSALTKLGQEEQLDDPDADTRAALSLNANWDAIRDLVLRAHLWNFAIDPAGVTLVADASYAPGELADHQYRYKLPADFIRLDLQRLRPSRLRTQIRTGGRKWIYGPEASGIHVQYVRRVEEVGEWDPHFAEAFAARLAAQCCERITGSADRETDLLRKYQAYLAEAKAIDGRENPPEDLEETDWVTARQDAGAGWGPV